MSSADIDLRRKRARYRAGHRGTKELDILLGRYAEARLDGMKTPELDAFETLLALPDPEIEDWLREQPAGPPPSLELAGLVNDLRGFHGLSGLR